MMMGRAGGIVLSLTGGMMIDAGSGSTRPLLGMLAIAGMAGVLCAFVSNRHLLARWARHVVSL
jgi:hypothetical protein